jgi:peptide/nickel transport system permease protein
MISFIAKRVLSGIGLLLAISTMAYFLIFSSSTNIALNILGQDATDEQILAKQQELGLNLPIFERYLDWLSQAIRGNFGSSWFNSETVVSALLNRLPVTLTIVIFAMSIAAVLAISLGTVAAIKGGWVDRVVQFCNSRLSLGNYPCHISSHTN